jgi:hypothetical protein
MLEAKKWLAGVEVSEPVCPATEHSVPQRHWRLTKPLTVGYHTVWLGIARLTVMKSRIACLVFGFAKKLDQVAP